MRNNKENFFELIERESVEAEEIADLRHYRTLRNISTYTTFVIISLWLIFITIVVILSGLSILEIDKNVMITLLATTTANVIGLPWAIIKGVFKYEKNDKKE
ncbi:hypothetical protein [Candidatus Deianiraea vastatrix]|uniref:Uncharacterized protein n=1 Tax=Candidatus Deianiraea vastatrix TaxID=2163644 RepID=A0A5B8XC14_9RICK|nr:hypothetical protein [Candidatus Deianiraea vastatrix]QED22892.1 hypothetical protein Deia_00078 [Candidatus Deianiraea vastatrix]